MLFITYFTALFNLWKEYDAINQPETALHLYLYTIQLKLDTVLQYIKFICTVLVHSFLPIFLSSDASDISDIMVSNDSV